MKRKISAIILILALVFSCAIILSPEKTYAEDKTFILKKADGTELGQYDDLKNDIIKKMKDTDPNDNYIIEVTKDYEFTGSSRSNFLGLNVTFTSKEGTTATLTAGDSMPHFIVYNGNYIFKNIILQGKDGANGGGIYVIDDNKGVTITLDSGTVIKNCKYVDAPWHYRPIVIRDKYDDGNDSKLIINDGVTIEGCKTNNSNAGCAISVRDKCKLIVNGGTFKNNDAQNSSFGGGVIFNDEEAETIINGGIFEGNKAAGYGGAVINYGKLTVNAGTFKDNEAKNGGAISSIASNSELTVNGGTFENNKSIDKWGGAIVAKSKVSVKNATFDDNVSGNGGAIFTYDANGAAIENCTFKNNSVTNENTVKHGGALFVNGGKDVSIKNNTFTKNTAQDGGALFVDNVEGTIEGNTFEENFADRFSSAFHVKNSSVTITSNKFKNNGKNGDKVTSAGTFMVESVKNNGTIEANGNTFENNTAGLGGAAVLQAGTVDFNGCSFNKNNASEYGGAMYITKNATANITNSKFENNSAKRGGAIVTELFSQANPAEDGKYANLTIADDVEFNGNFASDGYFNPPMNYAKFPELKFKTTSLMGQLRAIKEDMKTYDKVDSVLNNYDVYYANPLVTVIYYSNGGTPEEKIYREDLTSADDEITPAKHKVKSIKETGLIKEGFEFKGWNTQADGKGTEYKEGDTFELSSNKVLYAIWEAKEPEPKPQPKDEGQIIFFGKPKVEPAPIEETHIAYIKGYPENTVRPEGKITRAEAVTMVVRLKAYPMIEGAGIYKDVAKDAWYAPYVEAAYRQGILEEKAGEAFRPDDNITRGELAQLISHIDKKNDAKAPFTDVEGYKYKAAIDQSYGNERILGYPDNTFRPDAEITRAETAAMLNRLFERCVRAEGIKNVEVKIFKDLQDTNYWAYYEIIEAANTHTYVRIRPNTVEELWKTVIK